MTANSIRFLLGLALCNRAIRSSAALLAACAVCLAAVAATAEEPPPASDAAAQSDQSTAAPSDSLDALDAELLEGLGLDGLGELDPPAKPARGAPKHDATSDDDASTRGSGSRSKATKRDALDEQLLEGLDDLGAGEDVGQAAEDEDPFMRLFRDMQDVEQRIARHESGDETQTLERKIINQLDKLIEEARRNSSSSSSSSSSQQDPQTAERQRAAQAKSRPSSRPSSRPGTQPAGDSTENLRSAASQRPDMGQMQELLKNVWGELPPRLREQLLQSSVDEFLPKYELLIEEYFKALARKQQEAP